MVDSGHQESYSVVEFCSAAGPSASADLATDLCGSSAPELPPDGPVSGPSDDVETGPDSAFRCRNFSLDNPVVPCTESHTHELVASLILGTAPGLEHDQVTAEAQELCERAVVEYTGAFAGLAGTVAIATSSPSPEQYDAGDRDVLCWATTIGEQLIQGVLATVTELAVSECFNREVLVGGEVTPMRRDCHGPHLGEAIHEIQVGADISWPPVSPDGSQLAELHQECADRLDAMAADSATPLEANYFYPHVAAWSAGYRAVLCVAWDATGSPLLRPIADL